MKKAKPYRDWLVWWLQQKRKERNAIETLPLTGLLAWPRGTTTEVDGTTYLVDSTSHAPESYSFSDGAGSVVYVDNVAAGGPSFTSPSATYDPVTRTVGSGSGTVYDNIKAAVEASSDTDTVKIMPGTYSGTGIGSSNMTFPAGRVTLVSYTEDPADVTINLAAFGTYFCKATAATSTIVLRHITVIGATTSYMCYAYSGGGIDIQHCVFRDNAEGIVYVNVNGVNNSSLVFSNNKVYGQTAIVSHGDAVLKFVKSSSGILDAQICFNEFLPSDTNYLSTIANISGFVIADEILFSNNILGGTVNIGIWIQSGPVTLTFKNNIALGTGLEDLAGAMTISGDSDTNLANVDADYNAATNLNALKVYHADVPGTKTNDIQRLAGFTEYPFPVYIGIMLDDASAIASANFALFQSSLESAGVKGIWVTNPYSYVTNYTAYDSTLKAFLDGGHEVGCHGLTGSSLLNWDSALKIHNDTGGAKTVAIACSTATGADWNGILKDYTQWTGTITLEGETPINIGWQNGAFPTLADIKAEIDALTGWSADVQSAGVTTAVDPTFPAIALTDYSDSVADGADTDWIDADKTEYLWLEVKYGKDLMQSYIRANISGYSDYEITTYGCSFHDLDTDGMDALMEAGYDLARGNNTTTELDLGTVVEECDRYLLKSLARYSIYMGEGAEVVESYEPAKAANIINALGAYGGVVIYAAHLTAFSQTEFDSFLSDVTALGNVNIVTGKELAAVLDLGDTSGTVGNDLREDCSYLFDVENSDLSLRSGSPCIEVGVDPFSDGDGDQYDMAGNKVWDDTYDTPDGYWLHGVDMGAYSSAGALGYGYHFEVVSGTGWADYVITAPAAPELIDADDTRFFTGTTPNEIDATDRAGMGGDQFFFSTSRGLAIYDADLTGDNLVKADKYFGF